MGMPSMNIHRLLERAAAKTPDAPAIFEDDRLTATFSQLYERVVRQAQGLKELGLKPGDRLALFAPNSAAYMQMMWSSWCAGLTVVPINARLHSHEAAYIIHDAGARLCFAAEDHVEELAAASEALGGRCRIVSMTAEPGLWVVNEAAGEHPDAAPDLAWLFYTSGTTGKPKGVMLTHENLGQMALNFRAEVDQIAPSDRQIHFAPMSHGSGMYMIPHVAAGAANVVAVARKFSVPDLRLLLDAHPGALIFSAPTMLRALLDQHEAQPANLAGLKLMVLGGGPLYLADLKAAHRHFGARFAQIYGQGEAPMTITRLTRDEIDQAMLREDDQTLGSVGYGFGGVELRIDGAGAAGDQGEIMVRGPVVMRGYWGGPPTQGWLRTGDIGFLDAAGRLTLSDRAKDLIISGGMNIYPREVEEVLLLHPDVTQAAVIGRPDAKWGEVVVACVVPRKGTVIDPKALDALCLAHIARFKRPKQYLFFDQFPTNSYGKVLKRELKNSLRH